MPLCMDGQRGAIGLSWLIVMCVSLGADVCLHLCLPGMPGQECYVATKCVPSLLSLEGIGVTLVNSTLLASNLGSNPVSATLLGVTYIS